MILHHEPEMNFFVPSPGHYFSNPGSFLGIDPARFVAMGRVDSEFGLGRLLRL